VAVPSLDRKPIYAPRGVVATSQPLAAAAGVAALRRGGNAVDAAIATAIALTVVQPGSNDIGGDMFAIVWDGTRLHGLNASGRSPAALTRDVVLDRLDETPRPFAGALGGDQGTAPLTMPSHGWLPVTVPGAPAGWRDLHEKFGALPFAELFDDAVAYADQGYLVSPTVAYHWDRSATMLHPKLSGPQFAHWPEVFTMDGVRAPRAGERWRNPAGARTLRRIAETKAEAFYHGEIAQTIADFAARTGGLLAAADLAEHRSAWVDPICAGYRGYEVWEIPPNGQGIAALLALNVLDGCDIAAASLEERLHWQVEAMKLGFADAHTYVADPEHANVPTQALLTPEYSATRRALIGERAATPAPGDPARGGTVYLCAADADGMMVSLIQSTYMGFGSHVTVPGLGFGLQNRGAGFSMEAGHRNVVAPGKRPFHTIIPAFLTRDGAPVGPFGVMGGHMQPQGHMQVAMSTVDDGLDPQAALAEPRWYWHAGLSVHVEPHLLATPEGAAAVEGLRRRGHEVSIGESAAMFGNGQAIWRMPDGGYVAGSEPRADGCASAY
jgi:gamma-glutamyltranspeptidase/glutathione hydrolase